MIRENFDFSSDFPPNKYIVTKDGCVIVGRNWLHKDFLKNNHEDIKSGGWWHLVKEEGKMYFYSDSEDFGAPTLEDFTAAMLDDGDMGRFNSFDIYFSASKYFAEASEDSVLIREKKQS